MIPSKQVVIPIIFFTMLNCFQNAIKKFFSKIGPKGL